MAFSDKQKAKWATWYHQTAFLTQSKCNYRSTYAESTLLEIPLYDGFKPLKNMER